MPKEPENTHFYLKVCIRNCSYTQSHQFMSIRKLSKQRQEGGSMLMRSTCISSSVVDSLILAISSNWKTHNRTSSITGDSETTLSLQIMWILQLSCSINHQRTIKVNRLWASVLICRQMEVSSFCQRSTRTLRSSLNLPIVRSKKAQEGFLQWSMESFSRLKSSKMPMSPLMWRNCWTGSLSHRN